MNLQTITEALEAKLTSLVATHGATTELNQTTLDAITDELVDVLNTVNPTAPYPPKAS